MGRIKKLFTARRNGREEKFEAQIDTAADITTINMATACKLGFTPRGGRPGRMKYSEHPDDTGRLVGFYWKDVTISYGQRKARLPEVFIPTHSTWVDQGGRQSDPMPHDEQALVGHDFFQQTGAAIDYGKNPHELHGLPIVRNLQRDRPTAQDIALARSVVCHLPQQPHKRKRKK